MFGMASHSSLSRPGAIGYIVADRTKEDLLETAEMVGVETSCLPIRSLVDDTSIDMQKFETTPLQVLFDLIDSLKGCELIVVDPLIVFTGVDTNKYHLNAAKLIRINRFARDRHVTILGTHHATKARTDFGFKRAQDRISGSSALLGYTSTQLFLATPEETDSDYFEWTIVSHHAAPRTLYMTRTSSGFEVIRESSTAPEPPVEVQILQLLSVGPMKPQDLINGTGKSRATIHRTLSGMEQAGVIVKIEYGRYRLAQRDDHRES